MEIRLSNVLSAAAGVMIFDFVMCGFIAPKVFEMLGLTQNSKLKTENCQCGGGCDSCTKNITNRAQVIDVTEVSRQGVALPN